MTLILKPNAIHETFPMLLHSSSPVEFTRRRRMPPRKDLLLAFPGFGKLAVPPIARLHSAAAGSDGGIRPADANRELFVQVHF